MLRGVWEDMLSFICILSTCRHANLQAGLPQRAGRRHAHGCRPIEADAEAAGQGTRDVVAQNRAWVAPPSVLR